MDIATLIKEKNAEYLNLISITQAEEAKLSNAFKDVEKEIIKEANKYDEAIRKLNEEADRKIDQARIDSEADLKSKLMVLKGKQKALLQGAEQIKDSIRGKYNELLLALENSHTKKIRLIEGVSKRLAQNNEDDYEMNKFILQNSKDVSGVMSNLHSDQLSRDAANRIKLAIDKKNAVKTEIEQELSVYQTDLKDYLSKLDNNNSAPVKNERLASLLREYYGAVDEIERLKNESSKKSPVDIAYYKQREKEIKDKYEKEKTEIEANRKLLLDIEEKKYTAEKTRILDLQRSELENVPSSIEERREIDGEISNLTQDHDRESAQVIAVIKDEANIEKSRLEAEKARKLNELARKKAEAEANLKDTKKRGQNAISEFLAIAKQEIDELLAIPCDYTVGTVNDLSSISDLPESICIGKYLTKTEPCKIVEDIYGTKEIDIDNPILVDVRKCGNIIIDASSKDEENESLYRAVCGLTMKYLETFPLGSLKVHFIDANQHVWFNKFLNAFAGKDDPVCKQLITTDEKVYSILEKVNNTDCSAVIRKTIGKIEDLFDLYKIDKTNAFHLFVIKSGFSEMVESGNIETLRLVKNLMKERGNITGVRFIIVNDYVENAHTSEEKKRLLSEIYENGTHVSFKNETVFYSDIASDISYITADDADGFIERQCVQMADTLANKQGDKITYEDIGFGTLTPKHKYSSVLSIPVGKFGSHILEIPFNCGDEKHGPSNSGYIAMGKTNSGKSSFFHSLVINGCMKYSPDDLQFWLLDFKNGGASSNYEKANIPHIKLLSKNNKVDDAYCLFNLLNTEMDRRGALLNEAGRKARGTSFQDLSEYNECIDQHPEYGPHLSRIVVVIDEAQEMFSSLVNDNEDIQKIGSLIGSIAVKSRYVGIHMVMIVQNLSMGKANILRDNFVGNIKGKATFGVDEAYLRESGYGQAFLDRTGDIKYLKQGEAFITCNDSPPDKVKMAYCAPANFEKYFMGIRERYGCGNDMVIIGNKAPLFPAETVNKSTLTYAELLHHPKEKRLRSGNVYTLAFGEDAYSLLPAEFTFKSATSCVAAVGSDVRMMSSICRSLLTSATGLSSKQIYVCNGGGIREVIFNTAVEECERECSSIIKYKMNEIDLLVRDVYLEYMRRKTAEENEISEDNDPIFVIVNDLTSLSKVKANMDFEKMAEDDQDNSQGSNNNAFDKEPTLDDMSNYLASFAATANDTTHASSNSDGYDALIGRSILDVIKEICVDGSSLGIYFNFTAKNSDMYEIEEIFRKTTNKLVFNDFPADLSDANCPGYIIHSMLSGIRNDQDIGETLAVSIIGGVASKVRPVLYQEDEE